MESHNLVPSPLLQSIHLSLLDGISFAKMKLADMIFDMMGLDVIVLFTRVIGRAFDTAQDGGPLQGSFPAGGKSRTARGRRFDLEDA